MKNVFQKIDLPQIVLLIAGIFLVLCAFLVSFLGTTNFFVVVVSDSMQPTISRGDIAIIQKNPSINENDIIVFEKGEQVFVHRVLFSEQNMVRTKGDSNPNQDNFLVSKNEILGKSIMVIPKLGHINLFLSKK